MRDVNDWLEDLGLRQYAEPFAKSDIDWRALPHLTEQDLKDLGVTLGHRRVLMAAIAALDNAPATEPTGAVERSPAADGERRQLTVMFCDLVGSTALSQRLDPEDLREVLRAYQATCADGVGRFDGHIAKYIGDGLLIYFGYPQAHEDDARRAVNGGLAIVDGVARLNERLRETFDVELVVRIGIHTGLVVAGEMGGGETREAAAIVGETPNVAARLEKLAQPNTVVISASTQRLVDGLFDFDRLGPQRIKGLSAPVGVYSVSGESDAPSRFDAAARRGLTALVGRRAELNLLLSHWDAAKGGDSRAVLLSGEPGIGKSRILRAFQDRLARDQHSRILYYCSPYYRHSALYPVINQFERALRFEPADDDALKLDKLDGVLDALALPARDVGWLLASVLSLGSDDRYPKVEASPQLLRRRTLEALCAVVEAMAAQRPVLALVEDAHWADPMTLEFLGLLLERLGPVRVLLLVNCRPEFAPAWGSQVTALRLSRLNQQEAAAMIKFVAGGKALPEPVLQQLVERADGVPLFVEELTKSVLGPTYWSRAATATRWTAPWHPWQSPPRSTTR